MALDLRVAKQTEVEMDSVETEHNVTEKVLVDSESAGGESPLEEEKKRHEIPSSADVRSGLTLGEAANRARHLPSVGLLDLDVAALFKLGQVGREVAFGHLRLAHQVKEVGALDGVKDRHDHQA